MRHDSLTLLSTLLVPAVFLMIMCNLQLAHAQTPKAQWVAPAWADTLKNPLAEEKNAWKAAKTIYANLCGICHGDKGKGDGVAGMALKPRPANLVADKIQKQSDGAIYWKLTEGKAPMAAYNAALTEEQRWQLVNLIRRFAN